MIFQSRTDMEQIVDNRVKKRRTTEPCIKLNPKDRHWKIIFYHRCISGAQLHKCQKYIYKCGVAHLNLCIVVCLCASLI